MIRPTTKLRRIRECLILNYSAKLVDHFGQCMKDGANARNAALQNCPLHSAGFSV